MQPLYAADKVNNEIELCEVSNLECKRMIEKELLRNRISYYVRWPKRKWYQFGRSKDLCIICVNDNVREEAEAVVNAVCENTEYDVKFLMKKSKNEFF